jgi:hypothetical protein
MTAGYSQDPGATAAALIRAHGYLAARHAMYRLSECELATDSAGLLFWEQVLGQALAQLWGWKSASPRPNGRLTSALN